jgi:trimeric autotransporter adhesin
MKHSISTLTAFVCFFTVSSLFGQQSGSARQQSSASNHAITAAEPAAMGTSPLQQAVVPRLIKFNGTLRDLSGKPIAGPVDVTLALYTDESGGSPLWFETQTVQASSLGHYTVLLGAMTPAGVPMELFAAGEARWLGVQVSNLPEQSRVLLVSVPYAMKAGDAETLGGKPASAYLLSSQAGSVAATGAAAGTLSGLVQANALASTRSSTTPLALTATQSYIPVMTDNAGSLGNSLMYQLGSRIGVGTTAPAFGLDLNSNVFAIGPKTPVLGAGGTMRFRDDTGTVRWSFGVPGTGGATDFFLYNNVNGHGPFYVQAGAASYSLYMSNNGNVGVGTTTPGQKLSVAGVVESTSGGFKFPDGSVQTVAATGGGGVTSFNSRTGAVVPASNDYAFSQISGTVGATQLSGAYSNALTLSNASNSFTGNGSGVTNVNAATLGGIAAAGFATLGSNAFTGDQTVTGNLILNGTVNGWQIVPYKSSSCTIFGSSATCTSANVLGGYTGGGKSSASALVGGKGLKSLVAGGNTITDGVVGGTISGGGGTVNGVDYGSKVDNNWGTVGGGASNSVGDGNGPTSGACCQTISGGFGNWASGSEATIAGGGGNQASGGNSSVSGGDHNTASAQDAVVSGGSTNIADNLWATVAGGALNTASGEYAAVGGGNSNTASGESAMIPGGFANSASGNVSFAAGACAIAANDGSFVWNANFTVSQGGGMSCANFFSSADKQFLVLAPGGVWLGNAGTSPSFPANSFLATSTGAYLTTSGNWTNASDRNLKTAFEPLDQSNLLARIGQMPITSWRYKMDPSSIRHIGPMAQDFYSAFQLGNDDKHISTIDEGGVALAGVQALYRLSLKKDEEIRALARSVAAKDAEIAAMSDQIEQLRKAQEHMALVVERLARAQGQRQIAESHTP